MSSTQPTVIIEWTPDASAPIPTWNDITGELIDYDANSPVTAAVPLTKIRLNNFDVGGYRAAGGAYSDTRKWGFKQIRIKINVADPANYVVRFQGRVGPIDREWDADFGKVFVLTCRGLEELLLFRTIQRNYAGSLANVVLLDMLLGATSDPDMPEGVTGTFLNDDASTFKLPATFDFSNSPISIFEVIKRICEYVGNDFDGKVHTRQYDFRVDPTSSGRGQLIVLRVGDNVSATTLKTLGTIDPTNNIARTTPLSLDPDEVKNVVIAQGSNPSLRDPLDGDNLTEDTLFWTTPDTGTLALDSVDYAVGLKSVKLSWASAQDAVPKRLQLAFPNTRYGFKLSRVDREKRQIEFSLRAALGGVATAKFAITFTDDSTPTPKTAGYGRTDATKYFLSAGLTWLKKTWKFYQYATNDFGDGNGPQAWEEDSGFNWNGIVQVELRLKAADFTGAPDPRFFQIDGFNFICKRQALATVNASSDPSPNSIEKFGKRVMSSPITDPNIGQDEAAKVLATYVLNVFKEELQKTVIDTTYDPLLLRGETVPVQIQFAGAEASKNHRIKRLREAYSPEGGIKVAVEVEPVDLSPAYYPSDSLRFILDEKGSAGWLYYILRKIRGGLVGFGGISTGAGAVPGGSDGQLQYNDGGLFGGTAQVFWDDVNNRLGLGTSVPSYLFHLKGGIAFFENPAPADAALYFGESLAGQLYGLIGWSGGSDFLYLQGGDWGAVTRPLVLQGGGGNVGIGTTSPTGKLAVQQFLDATVLSAHEVKNDGGSTSAFYFLDDRGYAGVNSGATFHVRAWRTGDDVGPLFIVEAFDGAVIPRFYIARESGNVGIGTATPIAPLHVIDNVAGGLLLERTIATARKWYSLVTADGYFTLYDGTIGASRLVVDLSGDTDFVQHQLKRARIENRTADPATPAVGEIWMRTDI